MILSADTMLLNPLSRVAERLSALEIEFMLAQTARRIAKSIPPTLLCKLFRVWPPFLGAGIKIDRISADFKEVDVSLHMSMKNRNYVGSHFGGSLYAMTDPFYMFMLIENLGADYVVWDKSAKIEFLKPGYGTVRAHFRLSDNELSHIVSAVEKSPRGTSDWTTCVHVLNDSNEIISRVTKVLYVRKKKRKSPR